VRVASGLRNVQWLLRIGYSAVHGKTCEIRYVMVSSEQPGNELMTKVVGRWARLPRATLFR